MFQQIIRRAMGMNMGWMEIMEMEIVEVMAAGWVRPDAATRVMQIDLQDSSAEYSVLYGTLDNAETTKHAMLPVSQRQHHQPQLWSGDLLV
jgi:hypothetical protein